VTVNGSADLSFAWSVLVRRSGFPDLHSGRRTVKSETLWGQCCSPPCPARRRARLGAVDHVTHSRPVGPVLDEDAPCSPASGGASGNQHRPSKPSTVRWPTLSDMRAGSVQDAEDVAAEAWLQMVRTCTS